ncbi:hypothetical protein EV127DRAFT_413107 [Xylaria flabelliformis]|nr:hypothetical protein EV127DRAFT_413107 [Xylaria flabelliformis]
MNMHPLILVLLAEHAAPGPLGRSEPGWYSSLAVGYQGDMSTSTRSCSLRSAGGKIGGVHVERVLMLGWRDTNVVAPSLVSLNGCPDPVKRVPVVCLPKPHASGWSYTTYAYRQAVPSYREPVHIHRRNELIIISPKVMDRPKAEVVLSQSLKVTKNAVDCGFGQVSGRWGGSHPKFQPIVELLDAALGRTWTRWPASASPTRLKRRESPKGPRT